ncbi:universal stress protein [Calothrix sp. PCC 7507]|uniref:universal stress protein n=1 Tax=Calothrix sp. PCC 7507 TaxID=99598 RepID=UPI0002E2DEC4|nr:universal stress protein [Calothrix sp. PCC 7507]
MTTTGTVPEEIIATADKYHVTAIVMGKRGHQPWEQVLIGSVSQAVLEASPIPVILLENREPKSV